MLDCMSAPFVRYGNKFNEVLIMANVTARHVNAPMGVSMVGMVESAFAGIWSLESGCRFRVNDLRMNLASVAAKM
jgi:hypothetical protein